MTLLLFSTACYRGSHYDCRNSGMKILKKIKFSPYRCSTDATYINFTWPQTVQNVQNIKIRRWCDGRVYTQFSFPPSWIWAIEVSSRSQSHELQKWCPRSKRPCFALNGQNNLWGRFDEVKHCEEILKSYKIVCHSKNRLDVFIQKLPSKIYKMCSISGIKRHQKKLSSLCRILAGNFLLLNGPFP